MTEPKKSDHWNSLLDEIGVSPEETPKPRSVEPSSPPPAASAPPPRPRAKPEPKPAAAPAAGKKGGWNSLLEAFGLATPQEAPAPPAKATSEPELPPPAAERPPPRPEREERRECQERPQRTQREERPERKERKERDERDERSSHLLDEFKPRYKPEEPPFPPSRRREVVDDVAMDIDLDADFAFEDKPQAAAEHDVEPAGEVIEPRPTARRDDEEEDERGGRRRRRRRRGGRHRDGEGEATGGERTLDRQREPDAEEPPMRGEDIDLDLDAELPLDEPDEEVVSRREEAQAREEDDERSRRPRRRRRGRGGRDRDRDEARPAAEGRPPRRPERAERQPERARPRDEEDLVEPLDVGDEEDEVAGEHAAHKKIPTWEETVGMLIDANIAARSSRQADRGRPRRPRRGDR